MDHRDVFRARIELATHIYRSTLDPRMNHEEKTHLAQMACLAAAYWPTPRPLQPGTEHAETDLEADGDGDE